MDLYAINDYDIGVKYPELKAKNGSILLEKDGKLYLWVFMEDMEESERALFKEGPLHVNAKFYRFVSLFILRFGEYVVITPFKRRSSIDRLLRKGKWFGLEVPLSICVADTLDCTIQIKRDAVILRKFHVRFMKAIAQKEGCGFAGYEEELKALYDNHTVDELCCLNEDEKQQEYMEFAVLRKERSGRSSVSRGFTLPSSWTVDK